MLTSIGVSRAIVLSIAVLLFGCKKEAGSIGPQGDPGASGSLGAAGPQALGLEQAYQSGFIKGTIKGKRRDGVAFEEAFEYKVGGRERFTKQTPTLDELYLSRSPGLDFRGYADLNLLVENKGQANQTVRLGAIKGYSSRSYFDIVFEKQLPNNQLFKFYASTYSEPGNVLFPISREKNSLYKLVDYGRGYDNYRDVALNKDYYVFDHEDGGKVYFEEDQDNGYYKYAYLVSSAGVKSTFSTTYGSLRYGYQGDAGTDVFFTATTNLHEVVMVPADTYEFTNFIHDVTTGLLTFNYKISIEALRSRNSSRNPVEITGSASVTVANGSVMRRSGE